MSLRAGVKRVSDQDIEPSPVFCVFLEPSPVFLLTIMNVDVILSTRKNAVVIRFAVIVAL